MDNIEKLKEKVARDPSSTLFVPLAEMYRKAGRIDEAIEVLRDGIDRQPAYASARVALGKVYFDRGMLAEAREQFARVVEDLPENLYAQKKLGEICKAQGDVPSAIAAYLRVQKLNSADEEAVVALRELQTMKGMKPRGDATVSSSTAAFGISGRDLDATQAIDPSEIVFDDEAFAAVFKDGLDEEVEVVGVDEDEPATPRREASARRSSISDDEVANLLGGISVSDDEVAVVVEDEDDGLDLAEELGVSSPSGGDDGLSLEETVSLGLSLSEREALTLGDSAEEQHASHDLSEDEGALSGIGEPEAFSLSLAERAQFGDEGDEEECPDIPDEEQAGVYETEDDGLSLDFSLARGMAAAVEGDSGEDEAVEGEGGEPPAEPEEEAFGETAPMPSPTVTPRKAPSAAQEEQPAVEGAPFPFSLSLAEKAVAEAADIEEGQGFPGGETAEEEPASIEELVSRAPKRSESIEELASSFSLSLAEKEVEASYEEESEDREAEAEKEALFEPTSLGEEEAGETAGEISAEEAALFEPTSLGEEAVAEEAGEVPPDEAALFEPTSFGEEAVAETAGEVPPEEAALFEPTSIGEEEPEAAIFESEPTDVEAALFESSSLDEGEGEGISLDELPEEEAEGPRSVPEEEKTQEIEAVSLAEEPVEGPYSSEKEPTEELLEPLVREEVEELAADLDEEEALLVPDEDVSVEPEAPVEYEEEEAEGQIEEVDAVEVIEAEEYEGEAVEAEIVEVEVEELAEEAEVPEESFPAGEPLAVEEGAEGLPEEETEEAEVLVAEVFEDEAMDAEVIEVEVVEVEEYAVAEGAEPVEAAAQGEELGGEAEPAYEDMFVPGGIEIGAVPDEEMPEGLAESETDEDVLTPGAIEIEAEIEPEAAVVEAEYAGARREAEPVAVEGVADGLREADALIAGGDYRAAAMVYMDLLRNDPEDKEVLQRVEELGILARMMGIDIRPRRGVEEMLRDFLAAIEERRNEFYRLA